MLDWKEDNIKPVTDDVAQLARLRQQAMCVFDGRGRAVRNNEPGGARPSRVSISRTEGGNTWVFRDDIPDADVRALEAVLRQEPPLAQGSDAKLAEARRAPECLAALSLVLGRTAPVAGSGGGPAFYWSAPDDHSFDSSVVDVTAGNADQLLRGSMDDWLPDVGIREVFKAVGVAGKAVAVCASVRVSDAVHEAGVETASAHRRQGHALAAVDAWARAVHGLGALPCYSTSWDNEASQRTAARLGFRFYAADWGIG